MKNDKIDVDRKMFTELWTIYKKFSLFPERNDKFWEDLLEEAKVFHTTYNNSFGKDLIFAITREIERQSK